MSHEITQCKWQYLPPGVSLCPYISYIERGNQPKHSRIVLLFLHDSSSSAAEWLEVMEMLASDYRCIAPNMFSGGHMTIRNDSELEYAHAVAGLMTVLEAPQILIITRGDACTTALQLIKSASRKFKTAGVINIVSEAVFIPSGNVQFLQLVRHIPDDFAHDDNCNVKICDITSSADIAKEVRKAAEAIFAGKDSAVPLRADRKNVKLSLYKLFDSVSPGSVFIVVILRILQIIRRVQGRYARPYGGGWRKLTKVFLGSEYSKFMLGCYRLSYAPSWGIPIDSDSAAALLAGRFSEFLMQTPELHWHVVPGRFSFSLKRSFFCDVVEVRTDALGHITKLVPYFDSRHPEWLELKREQLDIALTTVISTYNRYRKLPSVQRPQRIAAELRRWTRKGRGLSRSERKNMQQVIERIMSAAVIFCEQKTNDRPEHNTAMPDMKRYRHPGWGMISVVARFSPDFAETDLWCQFNHVTADGAPMQEALLRLKQKWGTAGDIVYPALTSLMSRPESVYCGDGIFRSRVFADFSGLLALRKKLSIYTDSVISLAALVMWGMSTHTYFRSKKILLPVDVRNSGGKTSDLDIMVINPGVFRKGTGELQEFLQFNAEINRKLENIRNGTSESSEFLELCAMLHPLLYRIAGIVMRKKLQEIVGSVGLSILRDAEMFVSPLTDFQRNGFMTIGKVSVNTINGRKAGAISICGSREQIRFFLEALKGLFTEFVAKMNEEIDHCSSAQRFTDMQ